MTKSDLKNKILCLKIPLKVLCKKPQSLNSIPRIVIILPESESGMIHSADCIRPNGQSVPNPFGKITKQKFHTKICSRLQIATKHSLAPALLISSDAKFISDFSFFTLSAGGFNLFAFLFNYQNEYSSN